MEKGERKSNGMEAAFLPGQRMMAAFYGARFEQVILFSVHQWDWPGYLCINNN